jgi:hypothetical protein
MDAVLNHRALADEEDTPAERLAEAARPRVGHPERREESVVLPTPPLKLIVAMVFGLFPGTFQASVCFAGLFNR